MDQHVITIAGTHWPAWPRHGGLLVDLRLFGSGSGSSSDLIYRPDALRAIADFPTVYITAAAPDGFLYLAAEETT